MNRDDTQRLWARVRWLLRQPSPPDDHELRRAARLLAASRPDAVELLLAQWLAQTREATPPAAADTGPALEAGPVATGAASGAAFGEGSRPGPAATPGRAAARFGLREAALVTAGLAGGALVTGLLDAGDDVDADFGID